MRPVKTAVLNAEDPLSKALAEVISRGLPVIVMDGEKYVGILDDRTIRFVRDPKATKCGRVAVRAPRASPTDDDLTLAKLFLAGHFKALPVFDGGEILGIYPRLGFLEHLAENGRLRGKVAEVMSSPVITVGPKTTLAEARALMKEKGVHRLVIAEDRNLLGIFSTYDMAAVLLLREKGPGVVLPGAFTEMEKKPVLEFARKDVLTVFPDDSLVETARKMVKHRVGAMVVVDPRNLSPRGIVSVRDLLKHFVKEEEKGFSVEISCDDEFLKPNLYSFATQIGQKFSKSGLERVKVSLKSSPYFALSVRLHLKDKVLRVDVEGKKFQEVLSEAKARLKRLREH